jgi:hypothetical protein
MDIHCHKEKSNLPSCKKTYNFKVAIILFKKNTKKMITNPCSNESCNTTSHSPLIGTYSMMPLVGKVTREKLHTINKNNQK